MPHQLFDADVNFPQFGKDQKDGEKIRIIQNYLYMLLESLRYAFSNIDISNFNEAGLDELSKVITEPIEIRLSNNEGEIAQVKIDAGEIAATVRAQGISLASVRAKADSNEAFVNMLAEYGDSAASIVINAANAGSSASLNADIIKLGDDVYIDDDDNGIHIKRLYGVVQSGGQVYSGDYYLMIDSTPRTESDVQYGGDVFIYDVNNSKVFGFETGHTESDGDKVTFIANNTEVYAFNFSSNKNTGGMWTKDVWHLNESRNTVRFFSSLSSLRSAYSGREITGMIGFVVES